MLNINYNRKRNSEPKHVPLGGLTGPALGRPHRPPRGQRVLPGLAGAGTVWKSRPCATKSGATAHTPQGAWGPAAVFSPNERPEGSSHPSSQKSDRAPLPAETRAAGVTSNGNDRLMTQPHDAGAGPSRGVCLKDTGTSRERPGKETERGAGRRAGRVPAGPPAKGRSRPPTPRQETLPQP